MVVVEAEDLSLVEAAVEHHLRVVEEAVLHLMAVVGAEECPFCSCG